jgi:hypothetical protein
MSKLWCLYNLYGFDLSLDLVYDSMHILPFFLEKICCKFERWVSWVRSKIRNCIDGRDKKKPSYFKGWWPSHINDCLSYLKAEEYQHFMAYYLPYVLDHIDFPKYVCIGSHLGGDCKVIFQPQSHVWLEWRIHDGCWLKTSRCMGGSLKRPSRA